jgi:tryptophan synthase alpha chain
MSRLTDTIRSTVARGDRAFIPFLVAGHPDPATSEQALRALAAAGADVIEVGVPFADSLADGPVVQGAYHAALAAGVTVADCFALVRRVAGGGFPPIVLMTAYNLILRRGLDRFAAEAAEAGVAALLPPDLPAEEWRPLGRALAAHGLDGIRLVAPTTPPGRLPFVLEGATGFAYYVSRKGVTGAREALPEGLAEAAARVRAASPVPVAVGFGISTPEQAAAVGAMADGLVVGSALVRALAGPGGLAELSQRAAGLRSALRGLGPLEDCRTP